MRNEARKYFMEKAIRIAQLQKIHKKNVKKTKIYQRI